MQKFFTIAGPVNPADHYCLPPASRLDEDELRLLIAQKKYFILHAPRQTGKTTTMRDFARQLNAEGTYAVLYVNVEAAQAMRSNVIEGMFSLMRRFEMALSNTFGHNYKVLEFFKRKKTIDTISGEDLAVFLQFWSENEPKPIALFIDEIDSLVGDTLISVLRQLRAGYTNRPSHFPQSVCLIGVRDVRDYRIWSEEKQAMVLGGSAFNIKSESLRMADFTKAQVRNLYLQHTQATGQKFDNEAIEYAFELTQGQPWLVNALAYQACFRDITDRSKPITKETIERAKEVLIQRRDTHLDSLIARLSEPRVLAIIEAMILGSQKPESFPSDDVQYVIDLGLVARREKQLVIANPIYAEILPREITLTTQDTINQQTAWYVKQDKSLDTHKLLDAFALFFRENSEFWLEKFAYKEAGPHLLLMAFLQRVINGGGTIHREYALGRGRVDLLVTWKTQRIVIELKVLRGPKTLNEGLTQTGAYMRTTDATEGHLVIFDRTEGKSWDEKMYQRDVKRGQRTIHVWGM